MRKKKDNAYHIEKLKKKKNWKFYYLNVKTTLIDEKVWKYASRKEQESVMLIQRKQTNSKKKESQIESTRYEKELQEYSEKKKKYDENHELIMTVLWVITMSEFRKHIKSYVNSKDALDKLQRQYDTTDQIIIDISFQEIFRSNMNDFKSVHEYAEHIARHHNRIIEAETSLNSWILDTCFRMRLSRHLNFYIFQLLQDARQAERELTIDDMMIALTKEHKRSSFVDEKDDAIRSAKNKDKKSKDSKQLSKNNNRSNESKANRDKEFCDDCHNDYHDKDHCSYTHKKHRDDNWKSYELKLHLIKNWNKKNDFVSATKEIKSKATKRNKKIVKKTKSTSSLFSDASSSHSLFKNRLAKMKERNKKFQINNARRVNRVNKNSEFYLNSEADSHLCYDSSLFNEIESLEYEKSIEIVTESYASVERVEFITFDLVINEKKIRNTVIEMKYVSDAHYNLISTNTLCRKKCRVEHDDESYIIINKKTDEIFMIDTLQSHRKNNSYIMNRWKFSTIRKTSNRNTWTQWHRRLSHFNMKNVKKFVVMNLFDVNECNKHEKSDELCESCTMNKMHKTSNRKSMRADSQRRITRKSQRIHIDLAEENKIVKTSRNKRYAIIFIDDFTNYTWMYLIRIKNEYQRILKKFIFMLKTKNIDIESIRCDNVKENINDYIDALLKKHDIKWESIVSNNSHQNDAIERIFRTIFNRVRAILYDFKLLRYLWRETCHTIVYLKNINLCTTLQEKTSYEIWKNRKSNLTHLHSFETYCVINKKKVKKLDDQDIKCRLLRYENFNQYILWNSERRRIIRAVHVRFDENANSLENKKTDVESDDENDDYNYVTLIFDRTKKNESTHETHETRDSIDSKHVVETSKSKEIQNSTSNDENTEFEIFESKHDAVESTQSINESTDTSQSASSADFSINANERERTLKSRANQESFFARVQNFWNIRLENQDNKDLNSNRLTHQIESENVDKAREFAARIRKIKSTNNYKISKTFADIMTHLDKKKFLEAMRKKVNHHKRKKTWRLMIFDSNTKVIEDRWVFAIKKNAESNIVKWKTRWITKKFLQKYEVDFFETYSKVVKSTIWQIILALVCKHNYETHHVDAVTTYLKSDLE